MEKRARLQFAGRVQGVFFRANTRRIARELALKGTVQNMEDGSVVAVVEGEVTAIRELVRRLKAEVPAARVDEVREYWSVATGEFAGFEILR